MATMEESTIAMGEAMRGLTGAVKGSAEERSTVQDWGIGLNLFGTQIARRDTAWDQAKEGFLEVGGKEEDWESVRDKDKSAWWKELIETILPGGDKGIFQGPEGGVDIAGKKYDLENLKKIGSFKEKIMGDASAYATEGTFKDIMTKYTKLHAKGDYEEPRSWFDRLINKKKV